MKNKNSPETVDYMGTKIPASWLEKPKGEPKATTIIRRRAPSLQEQIQSMLRFHEDRANQIDEDFSDGNEYADEDSQSPHELVRDSETGLEMTRYEKAMLDSERPRMEKEAYEKAVKIARPSKKLSRSQKERSDDPSPKDSEDSDE